MTTASISQLLDPLNEAQQEAVLHIDGPMLILAGPGSGKTRVVTHRMAYLISQGIPSHSILALTFTNKAADEMRHRLDGLAPRHQVWTGTFHKFCARILRIHANLVGLSENFTIYDMGDAKKVVKQAIQNTEVDLRHHSPESLIQQIGKAKNSGVTAEQFQPTPGHALGAIVAKVYPEYQKLLQMANAVDFDDLLLHCVDLFRNSHELRQAFDEKYSYFMVDEYQDTNLTQYQLIRLLNHNVQNLAVTGDPDQSIYGWRGANINNILGFERDYPNVKVVRLEQNYRSTQSILGVADQLIANNLKRKHKKLLTDNEVGKPAKLVAYPSPEDESVDIADTIALAIQQGGRRPRDFAVFYRTNALSRSLEHSLRSAEVPYQVVNGHEFYQRKEIKDVVAYLHLLNNPQDSVAFERIINIPPRKIGKVTIGRIRNYAMEHRISMLEAAQDVDSISSIAKGTAAKVKKFNEMYQRLAEIRAEEVETIIKAVLFETAYRDWLTDDGSEEGHERANNVDELVVAAQEFDRDHPEDGGLERYLEQAALVSDTDVWESEADYVSLMTIHAAKGLEFPCVFIVGLEDGILPHERSSQEDAQIEEERRLLFVAITRAQEELQISRTMARFRRGQFWPSIASRFLMELPREAMTIFEPQGYGTDADFFDETESWDEPEFKDIDDTLQAGVPDEVDLTFDTDMFESAESLSDGLKKHNESAGLKPKIVTAAELAASQSTQPKPERTDPAKFRIGMRVAHHEYGEGTIVMLTGKANKKIATIDFEAGQKKFRLSFVPLRIVAEPN